MLRDPPHPKPSAGGKPIQSMLLVTRPLIWPCVVLVAVGQSLLCAQESTQSVPPRVVVARKATPSADGGLPRLPDPPLAQQETAGADTLFPASHHSWGRFQPGAWRTLAIVTETFDANGKYLGRSDTTQTETLVSVASGTYTLETTTVVDVGGKKLRGAAQQTTYSLLTDSPQDQHKILDRGSETIGLGGRSLLCQTWRLEVGVGDQSRELEVSYNPDLSPYLFARRSTEDTGSYTVSRLDVPVTLDEGIVPGYHAAHRSQRGGHSTSRFEVRSDAVPGGVISASETSRDDSGRRVRWSTTELIDYGQAGDLPKARKRWRLFRRNRD